MSREEINRGCVLCRFTVDDYGHGHHAADCPTRLPELADSSHAKLADVVKLWREKTGGPWLDTDPIEDFKLLNEIENEGFEQAHELMLCGHARGDYRDAGYVRGKPETYTGSEKCIGCEREAKLAAALASTLGQLRDRQKRWREPMSPLMLKAPEILEQCADSLAPIIALLEEAGGK
jgi:hypothetical protein